MGEEGWVTAMTRYWEEKMECCRGEGLSEMTIRKTKHLDRPFSTIGKKTTNSRNRQN